MPNQCQKIKRHSAGVDDIPGNARDREMGRETEPLGDLGKRHETWKPPAGEQGMSNRPDDDGTNTDNNPSPLNAEEQQDDPKADDDEEVADEGGEEAFDEEEHGGEGEEEGPAGEKDR